MTNYLPECCMNCANTDQLLIALLIKEIKELKQKLEEYEAEQRRESSVLDSEK